MCGQALDPWGMALAERCQGLPVTVLRSLHQDRVAQLLVDERPGGPQLDLLTARAPERLHAPSLVRGQCAIVNGVACLVTPNGPVTIATAS